MKHFYTVQEFNEMHKNWLMDPEKKNDDAWGRKVVEELFNTYPPTMPVKKIKLNTNTKTEIYYDLMVYFLNKTKAAIECKYRYDTTYPTHMCNSNKYYIFEKRLNEDKIQGGHLITCWPNGTIFVSNIFNKNICTEETHYLNITTNANDKTDGKKALKQGHYYKPEKIFYYAYFCDFAELEWSPVFSDSPINLAELERKYNEVKSIELF